MQVLRKILFISLGIICVTLSLIGIFVPVLPTIPLLLLAAYFFARSSNRALQWLMNNRWFGPYIRTYREGRGMAVRDKVMTLLSLWITLGLSIIFVVENIWLRFVILGVASGVTFHLVRIKTYRPGEPLHLRDNTVEVE